MSVQLAKLSGGQDFDDIDVMAPDYSKEFLWLWESESGDNRLNLSRDQLRQLKALLIDLDV